MFVRPNLEEISVRVERDCRSGHKATNHRSVNLDWAALPVILDCQGCSWIVYNIGFALTTPCGKVDFSQWEWFFLKGIGNLSLYELLIIGHHKIGTSIKGACGFQLLVSLRNALQLLAPFAITQSIDMVNILDPSSFVFLFLASYWKERIKHALSRLSTEIETLFFLFFFLFHYLVENCTKTIWSLSPWKFEEFYVFTMIWKIMSSQLSREHCDTSTTFLHAPETYLSAKHVLAIMQSREYLFTAWP